MELHPNWNRNNFAADDIINGNSICELFGRQTFDIIISTECLYYFDNNTLKTVLSQFRESLKMNGIFYATMITYNSESYSRYINTEPDKLGMTEVSDKGSIKNKLYVNISRDKEDVINKFSDIFSCRYCLKSMMEFNHEEESIHYIGTPKI